MSRIVKDIDRGWRRITGELRKMGKSSVKVGVLSSAGSYPEGGGANLADVATFNEFGTSRIPARPFMRQTFDRNLSDLSAMIAAARGAIVAGKANVAGALKKIGVWYTGQVKETFTKGEFVPNAPSTILGKGSSRPLIDTGRLRQSISHELEIKG